MARKHISVWLGAEGLDRMQNIQQVRATPEVRYTLSDALRQLVGEALARREQDCKPEHKGPVAKAVCGHCGKEVL